MFRRFARLPRRCSAYRSAQLGQNTTNSARDLRKDSRARLIMRGETVHPVRGHVFNETGKSGVITRQRFRLKATKNTCLICVEIMYHSSIGLRVKSLGY